MKSWYVPHCLTLEWKFKEVIQTSTEVKVLEHGVVHFQLVQYVAGVRAVPKLGYLQYRLNEGHEDLSGLCMYVRA